MFCLASPIAFVSIKDFAVLLCDGGLVILEVTKIEAKVC